jgi:glucosamine-6-phosphate deaminase
LYPARARAEAVKLCLEGTISPMAPASILRTHANATVYLDRASASLLSSRLQNALKDESQGMVNS